MGTRTPTSLSVIDELIQFIDGNGSIKEFFALSDITDFNRLLKRFLRSTMDQVRANTALQCTRQILKVSDLDDLELFREGVWKREARGVIKFPGQRDHTAHTLNNWLLGWYLYCRIPAIKEAMTKAIEKRRWQQFERYGPDRFFGHAWLYVSLLHDIGYMFEGALDATEPGYQNEHAAIGLRTANEYFQFFFWRHMRVDATDDRTVVLDEKQGIPRAPLDPSMTEIAMYLRTLDLDMKPLYDQVQKTGLKHLPEGAFSSDAFELWKAHYEAINAPSMAHRIVCLEEAYIEHATRELPGTGVRVLDHGTCSGLLQLKIATFFYRLFASMKARLKDKRTTKAAKSTIQKLLQREEDLDNPFNFEYWWSGIVWATAACAVHNMQQQNNWPSAHRPQKLALNEDPLAYLGILVDSIQDWDRYLVFHSRTKVPIQGIDVKLQIQAGKAVIEFPPDQKDRVDKLKKELNNALDGWEELVQLLP
jgi:hypothetical protein